MDDNLSKNLMASSPSFLGFDTLPAHGALLVPGRLRHEELLALVARLAPRSLIWLVEETAMVDPATQEYLNGEDIRAVTFSQADPDPAAIGKALAEKIKDDSLMIFIPGDAAARRGTACHIPPALNAFLCDLKLPTIPLAVSLPSELKLATESGSHLPSAIFALGDLIPASEVTLPAYQENLLRASESSFSSRTFLRESLSRHLLTGLKKHSKTSVHDGTDDSSLSYGNLLAAAIALSKEIRRSTDKKGLASSCPRAREDCSQISPFSLQTRSLLT